MYAVNAIIRNDWTRTLGRRFGMSVTGIVPVSLGLPVQVHDGLQPQEALGGRPNVVGAHKRHPATFGLDNSGLLSASRPADVQAARGQSAKVLDFNRSRCR